MSDAFENLLRDLLNEMDRLEFRHPEILDTDVRERMADAVEKAFVKPQPRYRMPFFFGLFSVIGNLRVRSALIRCTNAANAGAARQGITNPREKRQQFENSVVTSATGRTFDDYFGSTEDYPNLRRMGWLTEEMDE